MYIQGFVVPVLPGKKEEYRKMAEEAGDFFRKYGALEMVEAFEEDVRDGEVTDFRKAVKAEPGEHVVFSWVVWPDKATCDKAEQEMPGDPDMKMPEEMPFNGKRMIFGGFTPIVTWGR
jgi:uncharacterized protein YbaA (DUF1428 family)